MTSRATVMQKYPKAGAQYLKAIEGAAAPNDVAHWRIFGENGEVAKTIGIGKTEELACDDAAHKIARVSRFAHA